MQTNQRRNAALRLLPLTLALALAVPHAARASEDFAARCRAMGQYSDGDLKVTTAQLVPAGPAPALPFSQPGGAAKPLQLPEHCLVQASFEQRAGVGDKPYAIRMELRLPPDWNGRFLFQGGGGMNGFVPPAIGANSNAQSAYPPALHRGFAVVSTDTGHDAPNPADASFARDQLAKLNYAYAAIGKVTLHAKAMIARLAGKAPDHSYFAGCSNGGREAMLAAQRYPDLFDGVLASNPAFNLRDAAVMSYFSGKTYDAAAQNDAKARGLAAFLITPAEGELIRKAVLEQCDALDGAKDGMVFDHAACHFNVKSLECKPGQSSANCLAPAKAEAIAKAFQGPLDDAGKPRFTPWVWDASVFTPDWLIWQTGLPLPNGQSMTMLRELVTASLTQYFAFPAIDAATLSTSPRDIERLLRATDATAGLTVATSTDFTSFAARGGKVMFTDGWSDPIFSAQDLVNWYGRMAADMERVSGKPTEQFARLFMVPGMAHCTGGQSLDDMDALGSLVSWVEQGKAPDMLKATGQSFPGVSRPICAWPAIARYKGSGPVDDAASFTCKP
ncbi:tannase/feruloyl esterase family alpha/beta hydrolase [Duganella sp. FT80W]|uniref:Tannase/feruloyl esterase family alpha/beta hydrolase n=1 Tax=Duganella guangzhouensis TaxID=2666084 RepID=A0A6I2L502_9BURK|nr:tannase/feruloyl esterase family alpha/beta hydrolase [Duganella guangzhouensis]MRW93261.1 tannase/feruloyl esterase family alpha/beta hydrolase [Duganella guangzhouensis]